MGTSCKNIILFISAFGNPFFGRTQRIIMFSMLLHFGGSKTTFNLDRFEKQTENTMVEC